MKRNVLISVQILLLAGWVAAGAQPRKMIDLTHPFGRETVYWPTADTFHLKVEAAGMTDKGYYYSANSFCAAEHGGTHIDAPAHFAKGRETVDQIALNRLVAPGVLIDVRELCAKDRDYLISQRDLEAWEKTRGAIGDGVILLLRTGWGKFYPDRKKYLGTDRRGPEAVAELHFPGLDPAAAKWLVSKRKIAAIGLDTASIDRGQSSLFESHQVLYQAGIPAFENVGNLDQLPEKGFQIIALPMKIQGGSGAPLRIIAILDR